MTSPLLAVLTVLTVVVASGHPDPQAAGVSTAGCQTRRRLVSVRRTPVSDQPAVLLASVSAACRWLIQARAPRIVRNHFGRRQIAVPNNG
jgi:hypothetical protein